MSQQCQVGAATWSLNCRVSIKCCSNVVVTKNNPTKITPPKPPTKKAHNKQRKSGLRKTKEALFKGIKTPVGL